ncbi:MAG: hypothetical protein GY809_05680 [Planctomycetes bacterium]|nr:hypothetical protein [Planctomycetota bacterium]
MCKTLVNSVFVLLVLCLAANVQAVHTRWTDDGPDQLFSNPANWDTGAAPAAADNMFVDTPDETHCIVTDGVEGQCGTLRVGNSGNTTNLDITGGTFTVKGGCYIGVDNPGGHGILNVSGGLFSSPDMNLGLKATGTLNITGGMVELGWALKIPSNSGTGKANINGGILKARDLNLTSELGFVDITAGTMILDGNDLATLQGYIDDGRLTAYEGFGGTFDMDYDIRNEGETTVTATSLLNPLPADGNTIEPGQVELSWTLPDPFVPGESVAVDIYFTDDLEALKSFSNPAAIQIASQQSISSIAVQTQPKTWYYWAVDTYVGDPNDPKWGPIFSFYVDNIPPVVEASDDAVTWLVEGVMTKPLNATVTDAEATTVQWTVISEPDDPNNPDAIIADPVATDTTITLSALGAYVLQCEASDGEYTGSDTVTINVYNNGCEAAQSLPEYEPLVGDLNGDCRVDELDEALMLANWLNDNSLIDP